MWQCIDHIQGHTDEEMKAQSTLNDRYSEIIDIFVLVRKMSKLSPTKGTLSFTFCLLQ